MRPLRPSPGEFHPQDSKIKRNTPSIPSTPHRVFKFRDPVRCKVIPRAANIQKGLYPFRQPLGGPPTEFDRINLPPVPASEPGASRRRPRDFTTLAPKRDAGQRIIAPARSDSWANLAALRRAEAENETVILILHR